MSNRLLLAAALGAGTALSSPAATAGEFEVVSDSFIVLKGIPPRRKSVTPRVVEVSAPAAPQRASAVKTLTAEERRLLRYGVAEENKKLIAEAGRDDGTEEAEAKPEPEPKAEVAAVAPTFDASNTSVNVSAAAEPPAPVVWEGTSDQKPDKAALERHAAQQMKAEAPPPPNSGAARIARDRKARRGVKDPHDPLAADNGPRVIEGDEGLGVER